MSLIDLAEEFRNILLFEPFDEKSKVSNLVKLISYLENLYLTKNKDELELIFSINPEEIDNQKMIAILRSTFWFKGSIKNWESFAMNVAKTMIKRNEDINLRMQGLLNDEVLNKLSSEEKEEHEMLNLLSIKSEEN